MKRLLKELAQFEKEPLDHIYIDYKDDNIRNIDVLMIGARETPYSRMFLRFLVNIPDQYPLVPPKITFTNSYDKKIHPNVFPGGWICLSTLNSGDKHGWVPSMNLSAVLTTIYSMFTKDMIFIDNSHDHEKDESFFPGIMYDCFYITTRTIKEEANKNFRDIIEDYVQDHREWYIRKLEKLAQEYDGKILPNYYLELKANFTSFIPTFKV